MKLAYKAWDAGGKLVANVIDAADVGEARENLRKQGLFVEELHEAGAGERLATKPSRRVRKAGKGSRLKSLSGFCRQMYVLIKTGTPIVQALEGVERQTRDPNFKLVIGDVRLRVEEGVPLSEAMEAHPEYFDAISRSLIHAGESAGKLPIMLERISTLARKQAAVRGSIIGSMIYPTLLITVQLSVHVVMMFFVMPRFGQMFEDMDAPLPPSTQALMAFSTFVREYWWGVLGGIVAVIVGLVMWLKSGPGKALWDSFVVRVPLFGTMVRNFATARIARMTGILLDSYLPLLEVIGLVKETCNNRHYRDMMAKAEKAVTYGEPMSSAFNDPKLITPSVYEALRNGEQSGQIAPLMLTVADFMDEENEVVVKSLTSILEPIILILLGLVIGFVAISMFLPLFDLTASASGKG